MTGHNSASEDRKRQLTEAATDDLGATWRKSTHSNHQSACVEMRTFDRNSVGFRDSKDPEGPVLTFTRSEVLAFVAALSRSELTVRQ